MKVQLQCVVCGKSFEHYHSQTLTCSLSCDRKRKSEKRLSYYVPSSNINRNKLGAVSEIEMCAHYLREGYEVFRNVAPNGPADLIIWKPETGEFHILDIKTFNRTNQTEENVSQYLKHIEAKGHNQVKVIPYNHHSKNPLCDP